MSRLPIPHIINMIKTKLGFDRTMTAPGEDVVDAVNKNATEIDKKVSKELTQLQIILTNSKISNLRTNCYYQPPFYHVSETFRLTADVADGETLFTLPEGYVFATGTTVDISGLKSDGTPVRALIINNTNANTINAFVNIASPGNAIFVLNYTFFIKEA